MISDSIRQFLQDLDAKLPNEFTSEIDEPLALLADVTSDLLSTVAAVSETPVAQNVEYSRVDPASRVSSSDSSDRTDCIDQFPIHRPEGEF